jgi:hypothetical protein
MALEKGFTAEVGQILVANENGIRELFDDQLTNDEAIELGQRAARYAFAPLVWRAVAGDVLNTTQVTELLDISRQAIAKRVRHRSLLAIAGRGMSYFPVWQFNFDQRTVRPVVKDILQVFHDTADQVEPLVIVSWSRSPQREELEGLTPQEWIEKGGDDDALRLSAKRAAFSLSA